MVGGTGVKVQVGTGGTGVGVLVGGSDTGVKVGTSVHTQAVGAVETADTSKFAVEEMAPERPEQVIEEVLAKVDPTRPAVLFTMAT